MTISYETRREALDDPFAAEAAEDEWANPEDPFAADGEWEDPEAEDRLAMETEWEDPENPFATETEWEALEDRLAKESEWAEDPFAAEDEWEDPEAEDHFAMEAEWEDLEERLATETEDEDEGASTEADQFLPALAAALPFAARVAKPLIRRLAPVAKRAVGAAVGSVMQDVGLGRSAPGAGGAGRRTGGAPGRGPVPMSGGRRQGPIGRRRRRRRSRRGQAPVASQSTISNLLSALQSVLGSGESAARELEDRLFRSSEALGETADSEAAAEAELAEMMATRAAHIPDETEAQTLVAAALPIIANRILGPRGARALLPALVESNGDLVHGLWAGGPDARQLVRLQPAIMRRTLGSLAAARRNGHRVNGSLVAPILAGQAARVLGDRRQVARALTRNLAWRRPVRALTGRSYEAI